MRPLVLPGKLYKVIQKDGLNIVRLYITKLSPFFESPCIFEYFRRIKKKVNINKGTIIFRCRFIYKVSTNVFQPFMWPSFRDVQTIIQLQLQGHDSSVAIRDSLRAGRSGDQIPVGGEIFRSRPDRPSEPTSLLYNGYRVFPGGKAAGAGC